jgi:hypothetical protein
LNLGLDLIVNSFIQEVIFNILIVVGVLKIMIIQGARLMEGRPISSDQFKEQELIFNILIVVYYIYILKLLNLLSY